MQECVQHFPTLCSEEIYPFLSIEEQWKIRRLTDDIHEIASLIQGSDHVPNYACLWLFDKNSSHTLEAWKKCEDPSELLRSVLKIFISFPNRIGDFAKLSLFLLYPWEQLLQTYALQHGDNYSEQVLEKISTYMNSS